MLGLAALVVALLATPASAKTCAQKVIDDWVASPTIDGVYPLHCYREAIAALPEDAATYSSAADDIRRALQQRSRDQPGGSTGGTTSGTTTDGTEATPGSTDGGSGTGSGSGGVTPDDGGSGSTPSPSGEGGVGEALDGGTSGGESAAPGEGSAAAPSDEAFSVGLGDGGESLPLPVIVVIAALGVAAVAAALTVMIRRLPRSGGEPPSAPSGPAGS